MKTHSHNQKINNCTADLVIIDDNATDGFVIVLEANFSFALSNSRSHSLFSATDLLVQFRCDKSLMLIVWFDSFSAQINITNWKDNKNKLILHVFVVIVDSIEYLRKF